MHRTVTRILQNSSLQQTAYNMLQMRKETRWQAFGHKWVFELRCAHRLVSLEATKHAQFR